MPSLLIKAKLTVTVGPPRCISSMSILWVNQQYAAHKLLIEKPPPLQTTDLRDTNMPLWIYTFQWLAAVCIALFFFPLWETYGGFYAELKCSEL